MRGATTEINPLPRIGAYQFRDMNSKDFSPSQPPAATRANAASDHLMRLVGSSRDTSWATPQEWFDYLNLEFKFTLDPASSHANAKCLRHFTPEEDGLAQPWAEERVFLNPPYGRELPRWLRKAYLEARDHGALVVALVPARVDTEWWNRFAAKATEVRFPIGRLKFSEADSSAPFPVAIVIFRPRL